MPNPITFKTVIKNALDGFNAIQNKINQNSGQLEAISKDNETGIVSHLSSVNEILGALESATFEVEGGDGFTFTQTIYQEGTPPTGISLESSPSTYSIKLVTRQPQVTSTAYSVVSTSPGLVSDDETLISDSITLTATPDAKYVNIAAAELNYTPSALVGTNDIGINSSDDGTRAGTNISNILLNKTYNEPNTTGSYFLAFDASSSATAQSQSITATTPGYVPSSYSLSGSVSYSSQPRSVYFTVKPATFTLRGNNNASTIANISAPLISANNTTSTVTGHKNVTSSLIGGTTVSTTGSEPISNGFKYFIRFNTAADTTGSTVKVLSNQEGYVPASTEVGTGTVELSSSNDQFFAVREAIAEVSGGTLTGNNITDEEITIDGLDVSSSGSTEIVHNAGSASVTTAGYLDAGSQITIGNAQTRTVLSSGTTRIENLTVPNGETLISLTNSGTVTTMSGAGTVTNLGTSSNYSNTLTITNLYQNLTITNLQDAAAGTANTGVVTIEGKTVAKDGDLVPVTTHNGYVTGAGWATVNTQIYTLSYDSTEECVDFVWND